MPRKPINIVRHCLHCQEPFRVKQGPELCCSASYASSRKNLLRERTPPPVRECPQCGTSFSVPSLRFRQRYCTRSCAAKAKNAKRFPSTEERFWGKVDKSTTPDGCWPWTGGCFAQGYGQFTVNTRPVKAHRYAWLITNGSISDNLFVCRHCDNPRCCRPDHLFLGTAKDNTQDSIRKGRAFIGRRGASQHLDRYRRGEENANAKLTTRDVLKIRQLEGKNTSTELAAQFNVSNALICAILKRRAWRHI